MGNPSPVSKLKKTTTPSKTSHRHAPSSSATLPGSLDRLGKQDVASPERGSNGAGKSVASSAASPGGGGGGSGEKGIQSPAVKDIRVIRRRSRSSLGGTDDFLQLGIDFNQGNPPADEKKITGPPVEEKKHPFLLARGMLLPSRNVTHCCFLLRNLLMLFGNLKVTPLALNRDINWSLLFHLIN